MTHKFDMLTIVLRFMFLELGRDDGVPVHRVSADLGIFLNHQGACAGKNCILDSGIPKRKGRILDGTVLDGDRTNRLDAGIVEGYLFQK